MSNNFRRNVRWLAGIGLAFLAFVVVVSRLESWLAERHGKQAAKLILEDLLDYMFSGVLFGASILIAYAIGKNTNRP